MENFNRNFQVKTLFCIFQKLALIISGMAKSISTKSGHNRGTSSSASVAGTTDPTTSSRLSIAKKRVADLRKARRCRLLEECAQMASVY
ncbi:hypothetical protein NIES4073_21360 [Kalymmatonema gypsitolerans NIES-4073]|nr:hypothetical protein NIES4073_21360 [Scytonema sp. NIES-4073]